MHLTIKIAHLSERKKNEILTREAHLKFEEKPTSFLYDTFIIEKPAFEINPLWEPKDGRRRNGEGEIERIEMQYGLLHPHHKRIYDIFQT